MNTDIKYDALTDTGMELRVQLDALKNHRFMDLMEHIDPDQLINTFFIADASLDTTFPSELKASELLSDATEAAVNLEIIQKLGEKDLSIMGAVNNIIMPLEKVIKIVHEVSMKQFNMLNPEIITLADEDMEA